MIDYIYTYSNDIDSDCFNNINNCSNKDLSWINYENPFWTISSDINTHKVYAVGKGLNSVTEYLDVYPVVYLKYDVVIENGAGTSNAPYIIRSLYNSDIQSEYEMLQNDENIGDGENISAPDTLKNSSYIFFLICGTIIFVGLILLLISYFKSKKQRV